MFVSRMQNVFLLFSLFLISSSGSSEDNGTSGDTIDGEQLVKLGRQLHKPLLTLIGMAIRNMHPCEKWTQWSSCSASRPGFFGSKSRSRKCHYDNNANELNATAEEDYQICEGGDFCPNSYNVTDHGYCVKFYEEEMANDDAIKQCKQDGAYPINIESQQKYDDIRALLQGLSKHVTVGGHRKDVSSPWTYEYGSQNGFLKWHSGQPSNGSSELCMILDKSSMLWRDYACTEQYGVLCEIVNV